MATDQASESETDLIASLPRVDVVANNLRMSVDVLLGKLRNQGIYLNPGDRVPEQVVWDAMRAELYAGRPWVPERLERLERHAPPAGATLPRRLADRARQ